MLSWKKGRVYLSSSTPALLFFPPKRREKGFLSAVSKGQNHLVQSDRVGHVGGGGVRRCNYRPLFSVKDLKNSSQLRKTKRHSFHGSHNRTT